MKHLKFALLVIIILAAIPTLFFAQIKHESTTPQSQKEVLENNKNNALSSGENTTPVLKAVHS